MTEPPMVSSNPLHLLPDRRELDENEARYVAAARAANTVRGYRSDWADWCAWAGEHRHQVLPAAPPAISRYLTWMAGHGVKVGTMSRRLSSIRFAHRIRNLLDPTDDALVVTVWEGIRREHETPPDQAAPLMPPELFHALDACPTTRSWKTRPDEQDLAGLRDRALLLIGFVTALRRSEISALDVDTVADHPNGKVIELGRTKTDPAGRRREIVVIPRCTRSRYNPVDALERWTAAAGIVDGPLWRGVDRHNRLSGRRLHDESISLIVQRAVQRIGLPAEDYSAHSLRAGFVTYAHLAGASDRAIAHQTRHRSLATLGQYIRIHEAWEDNAATQLGL